MLYYFQIKLQISGGNKFVHEKCLIKWIDISQIDNKYACSICKTQ